MNLNNTKTFKLTLLGEVEVGKTQISNQLAEKPFSENYIATVGASMVKIQYTDKETGEITWFYLWDTAGQEKYKTLAPVYFRDSDAIIIVYDVSNEESFKKIYDWYQLYYGQISKFEDHKVLIVGNKIDLRKESQIENEIKDDDEKKQTVNFIDTKAGKEWADAHDCDFIETSAKTGENVGLIIEKMVEYSKIIHVNREESILNTAKKESSCC